MAEVPAAALEPLVGALAGCAGSEFVGVLILPIIDLLVLLGTGCLAVGFVLKAIRVTTHYSPALLGFSSLDFVLIAGVFLALALVLAARTWVKLNEPRLVRMRREAMQAELRREAEELDLEAARSNGNGNENGGVAAGGAPMRAAGAARAERG